MLVGWVANRAHHADVGGIAPGSMPPDALTVDEEGLRLPPTLLDDAVVARIVAASRTPDERRGDLDAQRGANLLGVTRFVEILADLDDLSAFDEILDYGERRMRAALTDLPDGQWTFADVLDSAGPRPEQQSPTRIVLALTLAGDDATFDFTGTGSATSGQRERGRGGDGERGRVRDPRRHRSRACPRTAARMRPIHVRSRPPAPSWRRSRRWRWVRATWR